jgi:hypothetical protein
MIQMKAVPFSIRYRGFRRFRFRSALLAPSRRRSRLKAALLLALVVWAAAAPAAQAQLVLTLPDDPLVIDAATGGDAIFHATLTNNYAFDLYLNSDSFAASNPATADDTLFQNYFVTPRGGVQPTLAANGGSVSLDLFRVTLPPHTVPGLYTGILTLQGGATPLDADDLVTAEFAVKAATPSAVPEAGSTVMLAALLGLSGVGLLSRRRTRRDNV